MSDNVSHSGGSVLQAMQNLPGVMVDRQGGKVQLRGNEKYFLTNIMPSFTGRDTFMLIADEHVTDLNIDYTRPNSHSAWKPVIKQAGRMDTSTQRCTMVQQKMQ